MAIDERDGAGGPWAAAGGGVGDRLGSLAPTDASGPDDLWVVGPPTGPGLGGRGARCRSGLGGRRPARHGGRPARRAPGAVLPRPAARARAAPGPGRHFGPLASHPNLTNPFTPHDELFELAASSGGIADEWHTDLTFLAEPAVLSILRMVQCPDIGGDTMWTNLELAYEMLSPPLQDLLLGLRALHDAQPHGHPEQATIHPVVRRHPDTGRPALYVNEHFTRRIIELQAAESDLLLQHLTRWVQDPRFTVRYRWAPDTVAMWDNRCTQHYVLNDFVGERVIQRVTVMGDLPVGDEPRWPAWTPTRGAASRHDWAMQRHLRDSARAAAAVDA